MGKIILPNAPVFSSAAPPQNSTMMLVHKKTMSTIMAESRHNKSTAERLQRALDLAFLENIRLQKAVHELTDCWTLELEAEYQSQMKEVLVKYPEHTPGVEAPAQPEAPTVEPEA